MFKKDNNEDQIFQYIEEIKELITAILLESEELQEIKEEMETKGIAMQLGIVTFLTKEMKKNKKQHPPLPPLQFKVEESDKRLLNEWGISIS